MIWLKLQCLKGTVSTEKKSVNCYFVSVANLLLLSMFMSSFCELRVVMIDMFLNCFSFTSKHSGSLLDRRDLRNAMLAGIQALYLIFARASQNLVSSTDWDCCHIFWWRMTMVPQSFVDHSLLVLQLRHDMGMGKPMIIWLGVRVQSCCTQAIPYPFPWCFRYMQVCQCQDFGQMSDHLTLLIYSWCL